MIPVTSQIALEYWRASGKRSLDRLRELVRLYAETRGELDHLEFLQNAAVAAVREWELES